MDRIKALGLPEGRFLGSNYWGDEYELTSLEMVKVYRLRTDTDG